MRTWGSAAAVVAAIRDDAAAEIERLERDAALAIDRLKIELRPKASDAEAACRLAAARQTLAQRETDEHWEDAQLALADREAWMAGVLAEGRRVLADASDTELTRSWLAALVHEAAPHVPGPACVVVAPSSVADLLTEAWRSELEQQIGKAVSLDFKGPVAGVLVRTPEGSVTFDNSVAARERRLMPQWRAVLAQIYDAAVRSGAAVEAARALQGEAV